MSAPTIPFREFSDDERAEWNQLHAVAASMSPTEPSVPNQRDAA